jgi:hypothetical protein
MKKILAGLSSAIVVLIMTTGVAFAASPYQRGSTGVDVSYPNCTASIPAVSFGIVGTEAGLGFSQNLCMASEAAHFGNLSLYANSGYPGSGSANAQKYMSSPKVCNSNDLNCIAYNYGYNQGLFAYNYAASLHVYAATWWLDVETMTTWISDVVQNQQSLQGERDALVASGATTVGAYSTTAQWNSITGTWHNGWPSWGATTWTSASQAQKYCTGHEFTGGPSLLMQFKSKKSAIDQDVAC